MNTFRYAIAAALLVTSSLADVAPDPFYSASIKADDRTKIQMVDERVIIDLYRDYALVTAEFNMKNHGEKTTLEVGFPNVRGGHLGIECISNFCAVVEGEEIPFTRRAKNKYQPLPVRLPGSSIEYYPGLDEWFLWNVSFDKGESKKITVTYRQFSGYRNDKRYIKYVLETGAGWYKSIDEAVVIVNLRDGLTTDHISYTRPAHPVEKSSFGWRFKDLEPTSEDNIFVYYKYSID